MFGWVSLNPSSFVQAERPVLFSTALCCDGFLESSGERALFSGLRLSLAGDGGSAANLSKSNSTACCARLGFSGPFCVQPGSWDGRGGHRGGEGPAPPPHCVDPWLQCPSSCTLFSGSPSSHFSSWSGHVSRLRAPMANPTETDAAGAPTAVPSAAGGHRGLCDESLTRGWPPASSTRLPHGGAHTLTPPGRNPQPGRDALGGCHRVPCI